MICHGIASLKKITMVTQTLLLVAKGPHNSSRSQKCRSATHQRGSGEDVLGGSDKFPLELVGRRRSHPWLDQSYCCFQPNPIPQNQTGFSASYSASYSVSLRDWSRRQPLLEVTGWKASLHWRCTSYHCKAHREEEVLRFLRLSITYSDLCWFSFNLDWYL